MNPRLEAVAVPSTRFVVIAVQPAPVQISHVKVPPVLSKVSVALLLTSAVNKPVSTYILLEDTDLALTVILLLVVPVITIDIPSSKPSV